MLTDFVLLSIINFCCNSLKKRSVNVVNIKKIIPGINIISYCKIVVKYNINFLGRTTGVEPVKPEPQPGILPLN